MCYSFHVYQLVFFVFVIETWPSSKLCNSYFVLEWPRLFHVPVVSKNLFSMHWVKIVLLDQINRISWMWTTLWYHWFFRNIIAIIRTEQCVAAGGTTCRCTVERAGPLRRRRRGRASHRERAAGRRTGPKVHESKTHWVLRINQLRDKSASLDCS
jgi:hypothetical protein